MHSLIIKELTDFRDAVRRDVIVDGLSRPNVMQDKELLYRLTNYGNDYLLRHREPGTITWFDFYFGDPAIVGMTWAYNSMKPEDARTNMDFFWRIWSETDPQVESLTKVQEEFADYCVQAAALATK
jgi:hypothetical protein